MATVNRTLYGLDASKYPAKMGKVWTDEEVLKLLKSIQKKKSMEDIAKEHERTLGGIRSYIRKLAVDYHFNDNRTIEEIKKFTGLPEEDIADAIIRHTRRLEFLEEKNKKTEEPVNPSMKEIVSLLKDIQKKLDTLLESR